jgi:predicted metal-binding membrane protein
LLVNKFIITSIIAFIAGVAATTYYVHTMSDEMPMPGGWNMSMMWMRMPGQTWLVSALSFLLMWLAMMVAMMMPSAAPMFIKTGRNWLSLCYMAAGYFVIWLLAGLPIYAVGMLLNDSAMRSTGLSRAVPVLAGACLVVAGAFQFSRWKMEQLWCCRSPFGCSVTSRQNETNFRLGCRQGIACCRCCAGLMAAQLILGIMNPLVMALVAIAIAAEKFLPRAGVIARAGGVAAIIAGIVITIRWAGLNNA